MATGIHRHYSPGLLGPRAHITRLDFGDTDAEDCECSYQGITVHYRIDIDTLSDEVWRLTGRTKIQANAAGESVTWREYECLRDEPKFAYPKECGFESYLRKQKYGLLGAVKGKKGDMTQMPDSFVIGSTCVIAAAIITEEFTALRKWHVSLSYPTYIAYMSTRYDWFKTRGIKLTPEHEAAYYRAKELGKVATLRLFVTYSRTPGAGAFFESIGWPTVIQGPWNR